MYLLITFIIIPLATAIKEWYKAYIAEWRALLGQGEKEEQKTLYHKEGGKSSGKQRRNEKKGERNRTKSRH